MCRPRMGAWIEIPKVIRRNLTAVVAPAWGRGLKSVFGVERKSEDTCRPRMGAWIEISPIFPCRPGTLSPPHGGVD